MVKIYIRTKIYSEVLYWRTQNHRETKNDEIPQANWVAVVWTAYSERFGSEVLSVRSDCEIDTSMDGRPVISSAEIQEAGKLKQYLSNDIKYTQI